MADDEVDQGYTWENEYERTWEALQEDDEGSLRTAVDGIIHKGKRKRLLEKKANIRLGMMRHLFLVLDMSESMEDQDLRPSRLLSSLKLLESFIEEYFDQNPISQLGVIDTRNKRAEKVTELGGNPRKHIQLIQKLAVKPCQGEPSLQNSLELAMQTLRHMPGHASREILIIYGSLTTCDPGDIYETVKSLKELNIRCSIIGLAAEVQICKKICQETKGSYHVILDETHFRDLLTYHVTPPPARNNAESSLIRMGFPHHQLSGNKEEKPAMCMCHLDSQTFQGFRSGGYFCPQCKSKYCELPVECKACGLTLVSAPHLARSYHHLFPLESYKEVQDKSSVLQSHCFSCQTEFTEHPVYVCGRCQKGFCIDCDVFIHEALHSCPGCSGSRHTQERQISGTLLAGLTGK
ncbi:general transcription factor IIH subunit 2 [Lingula anatina]|uniref:General transcription factor IIH subunit n=1 Tax=Lingula anatina TaxID=7574 RepID=A0A2R2MTA7_LINAN|nr:general transcription factor IIH subunit 2 [Lingula anatina]|eukprot:XP_023933479.1 general transcription factor IIH subunit 2 [Lingula anatina]